MVGAINAPETGNTFSKFRDLAAQASKSTVPPTSPIGGILKDGGFTSDPGSETSTSVSVSTSAVATASDCPVVGGNPGTDTPATTIVTSAWTTQAYTSTWTSDGQVYTTTAASTMVTEVPISTQTAPPAAAAATTLGGFRALGVTMMAVAVAMLL